MSRVDEKKVEAELHMGLYPEFGLPCRSFARGLICSRLLSLDHPHTPIISSITPEAAFGATGQGQEKLRHAALSYVLSAALLFAQLAEY